MNLKTDHMGVVLQPKRKKKRRADKAQEDIFGMPVQDKYPGPRNVPSTSAAAYHESGTQKKMSGGIEIAKNLVRKFPNHTAYELLGLSQTFTDIYDLRRYLSALKRENIAYNPRERTCNVVMRKTFTWRLV